MKPLYYPIEMNYVTLYLIKIHKYHNNNNKKINDFIVLKVKYIGY